MDRHARSAVFFGLSALALTPLVVFPSSIFPYVTPRGLVFLMIGSALVASAIFWCVRNRCSFHPPAFFVFFSLFVLWALVASLIGEHPLRSILPSYERMDGWLVLGILYGVFFALFLPFLSRTVWKRLLIVTLAVGGIVSVSAFAEALTQIPNSYPIAFFGNPTVLASFLVLQPFLALFTFFHARRMAVKQILLLLVVLSSVTIFLSNARGAVLALVFGIMWAVLFHIFYRVRWTLWHAFFAGISALVLATALGTAFFMTPAGTWVSNAVSQEITSLSSESRAILWGMALNGFAERPLLGYGYRSFDVVFERHYRQELIAEEPWFDSSHSAYLDILIDSGPIGLALYALFFGTALYAVHARLAREMKQSTGRMNPRVFLAGGLAAYLVNNFFIFQSLAPTLIAFAIIAYLLTDSFKWRVKEEKNAEDKPALRMAFLVLLWGFVASIIFVSLTSLTAAVLITNGSDKRTDDAGQISLFQRALSLPVFDPNGRAIAIAGIALRAQNSEGGSLFTVSQNEARAQAGDARALYAQGSYALFRDDPSSATRFLEAARDLAPAIPHIRNALGEAYRASGRFDRAREEYQAAYALALELPATSEFQFYIDAARVRFAATLIEDNREEEAERLLGEYYGTEYIPYAPELLVAYDAMGNGRRVLELLQAARSQEPENPQHCFSFAAAELKFRNADRAIDALNECATEFPEQRAEAEAFIRSIRAGTIDTHAL